LIQLLLLADNNRSMWSADDVSGVRYVASCRLACSCGFDVPRYADFGIYLWRREVRLMIVEI